MKELANWYFEYGWLILTAFGFAFGILARSFKNVMVGSFILLAFGLLMLLAKHS